MYSNKLIEIDDLILNSTKENLNRLLFLSEDDDEEVRYRSIEALEGYPVNEVMLIRVRNGLSDADELVRVTCVELIGEWKDIDSERLIKLALEDSSILVKSSAMISLGQMGLKRNSGFLESQFQSLSGSEKMCCATSLYLLDEKKYLDQILSFLNDSDYRVRSATVNLVARFIKDEDKEQVIIELKKALSREKAKAVISSITHAIEELEL